MNELKSEEEYLKEAKEFVSELTDFHMKIGSPLRRIPTLGGKELDVYHLYRKVQSMGGFDVVSQGRLWGEVARSFNLPPSVTSASYAIRHHYMRLLEKYETCQKDPSYLAYMQSNASAYSRPTPSISSSSQSYASAPSPSLRLSAAPPTTTTPTVGVASRKKPKKEGYDRLARSLLSGFPNEVDFAFNSFTILAFKSPSSFSPAELPHLLDLMLAHVAVFPDVEFYDDLGLEALYHESWYKDSDTDFIEFWAVTVPDWVYATIYSRCLDIPSHVHDSLFASRRCVSEWAVEGYRVSQMAYILDSLSMHTPSLPALTAHHGVLKFLLLASQCSVPDISSAALDALVALAPALSLPETPPSPLLTDGSPLELLFHCMLNSIFSNDRMIIIKGLHVLSKLTWASPDTDFIEHVHKGVWQKLFQLLLLPDVQLVLLSLDTLYQFTSQGSVATAAAMFHQVQRCCEVLVSLVTLDIKSFGQEALDTIQLLRVTRTIAATPTSQSTSKGSTGVTTNLNRTNLNIGSKTISSPKLNPGTKPLTTQTIKIGNCVIPVVSGASPLLQGHKLTPPTSSGGTKLNRGPTVLTIQQLQNLLGKSLVSPSLTVKGGSSVTITGGSNVTIHRRGAGGMPPNEPAESADIKTISNGVDSGKSLLRSYLEKSTSEKSTPSTAFTATSLPLTSRPSTTSDPSSLLRTALPARSTTPTPSLTIAPSNSSTPSLTNAHSNTPSPLSSKTPPPRDTVSPSPSSTPSPSSSSNPSTTSSRNIQSSKAEEFATQWLESSYESSRGSYIAQLEVYALYLLANTKSSGHASPLSNADFNNTLRKVFPNALSTRVSVGTQAVHMIAGLAKKRSPGDGQQTLAIRDTNTLTSEPIPASSAQGGVVMKQSHSLTATPSTGLTGLRPDYSTQSPLAISSKATLSDADRNVGVAMNGGDGVEFGGVSKAKRIKLTPEEEIDRVGPTKMDIGEDLNSELTSNGTGVLLSNKLEKLVKKNHQLLRHHSPIERSPSPSFRSSPCPSPAPSMDSTLHSSPVSSRTISPLPPDTPPGPTQDSSRASSLLTDASSLPSNILSSSNHTSNALDSSSNSGSRSTGVVLTGENVRTCLWDNCHSLHQSWSSLLHHVVTFHLSSLSSLPSPCLWSNCPSKAKRHAPSLMAHLQACHCGGSSSPSSSLLPNPQKALTRLKSIPPLQHEAENPLTKAVRLTAALVLRNLAELLPEARRRLKAFESELCQVALSTSEASTAVAQCLHNLHNNS